MNRAELEALLSQEELGREYIAFTSREGDADQPKARNDDDDKEIVAQMIPLILEAYSREVISRGKLRELARMLKLAEGDVLRFAKQ